MTLVVEHVGGGEPPRETEHRYDFRDRLVWTINPLPPHEYAVYDNLHRVTSRASFVSEPSVLTPPSDQDRGRLVKIKYSQRGLVFDQSIAIDPTDEGEGFLTTLTWFDQAGRSVATWGPNGGMTKTQYDGLGRPKEVYMVAGGHQTFNNIYNLTSHSVVLSQDIVVEQPLDPKPPCDGSLDPCDARCEFHRDQAYPPHPVVVPHAGTRAALLRFHHSSRTRNR